MCPSSFTTVGMKLKETSTKRTFVSVAPSIMKTCAHLTGLRSTLLTKFSKMIGKSILKDLLGLSGLAINLQSGRLLD
jgi:hypothetical protein